jgi:hypothetical protein
VTHLEGVVENEHDYAAGRGVRRVEWTTQEDEEGGVRGYEQLVSGDKRIKDT